HRSTTKTAPANGKQARRRITRFCNATANAPKPTAYPYTCPELMVLSRPSAECLVRLRPCRGGGNTCAPLSARLDLSPRGRIWTPPDHLSGRIDWHRSGPVHFDQAPSLTTSRAPRHCP